MSSVVARLEARRVEEWSRLAASSRGFGSAAGRAATFLVQARPITSVIAAAVGGYFVVRVAGGGEPRKPAAVPSSLRSTLGAALIGSLRAPAFDALISVLDGLLRPPNEREAVDPHASSTMQAAPAHEPTPSNELERGALQRARMARLSQRTADGIEFPHGLP
jgi:hypothetical protein